MGLLLDDTPSPGFRRTPVIRAATAPPFTCAHRMSRVRERSALARGGRPDQQKRSEVVRSEPIPQAARHLDVVGMRIREVRVLRRGPRRGGMTMRMEIQVSSFESQLQRANRHLTDARASDAART